MARKQRFGFTWWTGLVVVGVGVAAGLALERLTRAPARLSFPGLLPSFEARLSALFLRLRARGYDPAIADSTSNDPLSARGASAHVVSAKRGTSDPGFFHALEVTADELGLTWGGRPGAQPRDPTLIQAIPGYLEAEFRSLETTGAREQYLREMYAA